MKTLKTLAAAAILAVAGTAAYTALSPETAIAQSSGAKATVDAAKAAGTIGEAVDGYLYAVAGANPSGSERAAMEEINIGRKAVYTRLAREQNVSVAVVAALTGEKQVAKARPGEKVLLKDGSWSTN